MRRFILGCALVSSLALSGCFGGFAYHTPGAYYGPPPMAYYGPGPYMARPPMYGPRVYYGAPMHHGYGGRGWGHHRW